LPDTTEKLQDKKKPFLLFYPFQKTKLKLKNLPRNKSEDQLTSVHGAEGLQLEDQKSTKSGYAGSMQTNLPAITSHHKVSLTMHTCSALTMPVSAKPIFLRYFFFFVPFPGLRLSFQ
jgi:hypothetical protein